MAKKRNNLTTDELSVPENLTNHPFYGLSLDPEQEHFRDCIYSNDYDIVFCNARAGTGKTLVAVGTANLLVKYGSYDGIVYISAPCQEENKVILKVLLSKNQNHMQNRSMMLSPE